MHGVVKDKFVTAAILRLLLHDDKGETSGEKRIVEEQAAIKNHNVRTRKSKKATQNSS